MDFVSSGSPDKPVLVTHWYDRKLVTVASTLYPANPTDNVERWNSSQNKKVTVERPYVVKMYNKGMGGVDLVDQYVASYKNDLKSMKWYKKFFYFFLDLSIANAYACYKVEDENKLDFVSFKLEIAEQLLTGESTEELDELVFDIAPADSAGLVLEAVRLDGKNHLPAWIDGGGESKQFPKHCKIRACKSRSRSYCIKCRVYLCNNAKSNCFIKFHTETNKYKI